MNEPAGGLNTPAKGMLMLSTPVIHFSTLKDLLDEFGYASATVRVSTGQRTETKAGAHFPRKIMTIAVYVRGLSNGCILSYMPFSESIEISVMTQHESPSPQQRYEAAWREAELVATDLRAAIARAGHEPRPGTLDLGGVEPVMGEKWTVEI